MRCAVTIGEMMDRGVWETFCDMRQLNVWMVNEGMADREDVYALSEYEARDLGFLPNDKRADDA